VCGLFSTADSNEFFFRGLPNVVVVVFHNNNNMKILPLFPTHTGAKVSITKSLSSKKKAVSARERKKEILFNPQNMQQQQQQQQQKTRQDEEFLQKIIRHKHISECSFFSHTC